MSSPSQKRAVKPPHHDDEVVELVSVDDGRSSLVVIIRSNKQERETRCAKVKDAESKVGGARSLFLAVR